MIKKALAVALCFIIAAVSFAACEDKNKMSDEELHAMIEGVWVPTVYDLTTNDPFMAVMFTDDKHYLYDFGGGEKGSRNMMMQEGTEYSISDGNVVIKTANLGEDERVRQYKAAVSFPDRDTMIWGTGNMAETYRRMTDDEIAFFELQLDYYNPDYDINETKFTIPMTGGSTTTGGSGSNNFENAVSNSMRPFIEYYETWDPSMTYAETQAPQAETEGVTANE
jgi:hypothetical protein